LRGEPQLPGSNWECEEYEGLSFEAIEALFDKYEFRHVIICVHAGCRAIPYWLKPDREIESDIGGFRRRFESGARNLVDLNYFPNSDLERVRLMVCEHILCQVENCLTHPVVKSRVESKRTDFHAWLACDETARVYAYDPNESAFKKI
ncbi:MAG: carbonic anhydrase, partial [Planctomycetota bacterium]